MIYIVTGFKRSGTSMMMRAFIEGGIEGGYDIRSERWAERRQKIDGYITNKGGIFELDKNRFGVYGFPNNYENKVIKVMYTQLLCLYPTNGIHCIMMRRNKEEIQRSFTKLYKRPYKHIDILDSRLDDAAKIMMNRRDVKTFTEISYNSIVFNPEHWFRHLKQLGWPIDVEKAASIIDPKQYRERV